MINLTVGRVYVFLLYSFRCLVEFPAAESHHLSADAYPRENNPACKAVNQLTVILALVADACLCKKLFLVSFMECCLRQCLTVGQRETESELAYRVIAEAAAAEILHTNGYTIDIVVKHVLEVVGHPLVDDEHRLAVALLFLFLVREFAFLYLDVVFLCQPAQRLRIGHLLMLHDEAHGIAALSA